MSLSDRPVSSPSGPPRRRRRPVFTIVALALLALIGYYPYQMHRPVREPVRVLFGPKPVPLFGSAAPALPVDLAASAPAESRRKPGPGEVELCGVGVYKETDVLAGRVQPEGLPDLRLTGEALVRELSARPEPQARAAALALQATAPKWNGMSDEIQASANRACAGPDAPGASASGPGAGSANDAACRAESERLAQLGQAEAFAATQPLTQLVQLAQQSSDPAVFALANDLCSLSLYRGVLACKTDLLDQWARLEPANAQPWLLMLARAAEAKDAQAQYQALYQASQAAYQRGYTAATMPWLLRDVPAGQLNAADLVRDHLAGRLAGMQFAHLGAGAALYQSCKGPAVQDGNRRQLCATLADTLSRQADNPQDALLAAGVGQQTGWSEARYQAVAQPLRDVRDAASAMLARMPSGDEVTGLGCDAVAARSAHLRTLGRQGEWQTMREALAASGKPVAELAAQYRADMAKAAAQAAARR